MFSDFLPIAAFFAGMVSVLSPCILPVIPAVFAYSTEKGKFRPLAIVLGLSISFTSMGIITSIFGAKLTPYLGYLNIFAEILLITMGIALIFDLNIFNFFGNFSFLANSKREGLFGGLLLGLSLGIVWLPCVGKVLGAILTMVAISGKASLWSINAFHLFYRIFYSNAFCSVFCKLFLLKNKGCFKIRVSAKNNCRFNNTGSRFLYGL